MSSVVTYSPADITIYQVGNGVVLKEKSLVAIEPGKFDVLAFGDEAMKVSEGAGNVQCFSPLHQGLIDDFVSSRKLMKYMLEKAFGKLTEKPALVICLPRNATKSAVKAYEEVLYASGARTVKSFAGNLDEYLNTASDKEVSRFKAIIEIGKENPEEYAKELVSEMYARATQFGLTKEQLVKYIEEYAE